MKRRGNLRFTLYGASCQLALLVLRIILLLRPALAISNNDERTTYPFTFVDDLNRQITLKEAPKRIISIGPANTEILFAISAGGQVVGVSRYCDYPPKAKQLEQVGGLISPAFDKIVALEPDLAIVGISINRDTVDKLTALRLNVALIAPSDLNEIYRAIQLMGKITNRGAQAEKLVADIRGRVKTVEKAVAKIPKEQRLRVFYELWPDPMRSAGPGSFIHELIGLAGGINIASDAKTPWPLFSLETLVERHPQVIFTTRKESLAELKAGQRKAWASLAAVQTGRVYLLDNDEISRPGPRVVRGLEAMARCLYPEQFKEEMNERKGRKNGR